MNLKLISILMVVLLTISGVNAQHFSVEDIETGRFSYLAPETLTNLQWKGEENTVVYSKGDTLFSYDPSAQAENIILSLELLNEILELQDEEAFSSMPSLEFITGEKVYIETAVAGYFLNLMDYSYEKASLAPDAENILPKLSSQLIAYTYDNNVWLANVEEGVAKSLTLDDTEGVVNGEYVYRNEFGMTTGMFWSPKGKSLAFYRKDESKVEKYPLVDMHKTIATVRPDSYPMAGQIMENTELWTYSVESEKLVKINPPKDAGIYLTNPSWSVDENILYVQHLNRGQDTLMMNSYSLEDGRYLETLFIEVHPKYVEPMHTAEFLTENDEHLYFQSERDGFNQLYRYDLKRKEADQLTKERWDITEVLVAGKAAKSDIYYMSNGANPMENHLFCFNQKKGKSRKITTQPGTHAVQLSKDQSMFIDQFSSKEVVNRIQVCDVDGEVLAVLLDAENPAAEYELGEVEIGSYKAADGETDLWYQLTKPVNFDPEKKYPLIVYVYGGPHVQLITNSYMGRIDYLQQYFAQHGYASLTIDTRGSDNRGREFEDAIFREHGAPQLEDQYAGFQFISQKTWIDTSRIGVHGWSYGGFMTLNMMTTYPDIYKVGVAGGAVTDWSLYEVMYGERYMDTPEENPEGYQSTRLIDRAGDLEGKLLMIHGGIDNVVVPQHALLFLQACVSEGKLIDFFIYPDHEHNVRGTDRVHLTRMITEYFFRNL